MTFRITHVHLKERTRDSWEYNDLISALTVAKSVINFTADQFDPKVWELMTLGFIENEDKSQMVFLWQLGENNFERPVVGPQEFAKGVLISTSRAKMGQQH